jgi:hypothetical protein
MTVSSANSAPSAGLLALERLLPFALVCAVALPFLLVLERAALGGLVRRRSALTASFAHAFSLPRGPPLETASTLGEQPVGA